MDADLRRTPSPRVKSERAGRAEGTVRVPSCVVECDTAYVIPVDELDNVAQARLEDARALSAAGRFDGATYLCGYAVEIALKARICRTLDWPEFPSTGNEFEPYRSFRTHELEILLHLSGQEARIKQDHFGVWNVVTVWRVETRYSVIGTAQRQDAAAMIAAAEELLAVL